MRNIRYRLQSTRGLILCGMATSVIFITAVVGIAYFGLGTTAAEDTATVTKKVLLYVQYFKPRNHLAEDSRDQWGGCSFDIAEKVAPLFRY